MPLLHANSLIGILLAQALLVRNLCYLQKIEDSRKSTNGNLQTSDGEVLNEVGKSVPGMARLLIVLRQKKSNHHMGQETRLSVPQGGSTKVWSLQWPVDSFEDGQAKMRHFNVSSFDFPHDAKSFISLGHVALQRKSCLVPCTLSNRRRFLCCLCWQCSNSALDFITVSKNCKRRQTNDQLVFSCGLSVILMGSCLNKSSNHYTPVMCNH